jgi:hypothetical protein
MVDWLCSTQSHHCWCANTNSSPDGNSDFGFVMQLLNAKPENVERESEIVAQSGRSKAVTIATNMAGRGTDIILGGNPEYMARYIHCQPVPL